MAVAGRPGERLGCSGSGHEDCAYSGPAPAGRQEKMPTVPPASIGRHVPTLGFGAARPQSPDDLTNRNDWFHIGLSTAAPVAYNRAGLGPRDVDTAMIYDCFTFEALHQLEEAGFCAPGDGDRFVQSGAIRLGGAVAVNTPWDCSPRGTWLGMSHVAEAVRQVRGEATGRQVANAQVAAVTGWEIGRWSMALLGGKDHK
ncbi:hypothetical protein FQA39_LY19203 [Lamprigera yunnana]|nr:hypothetical protein FQA39_LY19203 [Lamprigera yunnana]